MAAPPLAGRKVQTAQGKGLRASGDAQALVRYIRNGISTDLE